MKVKVIKAGLSSYWYADRVGQVFEVDPYTNQYQPQFGYKVLESSDGSCFNKDDVEIIEEKTMKKCDLKTGDLIVLSGTSGVVRVYKDTEQGDIIAGDTWYPLKDYTDDRLFNWTTESIYSDQFLEVWRPNTNSVFSKTEPSEYTHTLIWKKEVKTEEQKQLDILMKQIADLQKIANDLQSKIIESENRI